MSELPITRTMYLICSSSSRYLTELVSGEPTWSAAPQDAVAAGMAWLSSTEAAARLREFRKLQPHQPASMAMLVMQADPATPQQWQPVSVRSWGDTTAYPLVG